MGRPGLSFLQATLINCGSFVSSSFDAASILEQDRDERDWQISRIQRSSSTTTFLIDSIRWTTIHVRFFHTRNNVTPSIEFIGRRSSIITVQLLNNIEPISGGWKIRLRWDRNNKTKIYNLQFNKYISM